MVRSFTPGVRLSQAVKACSVLHRSLWVELEVHNLSGRWCLQCLRNNEKRENKYGESGTKTDVIYTRNKNTLLLCSWVVLRSLALEIIWCISNGCSCRHRVAIWGGIQLLEGGKQCLLCLGYLNDMKNAIFHISVHVVRWHWFYIPWCSVSICIFSRKFAESVL